MRAYRQSAEVRLPARNRLRWASYSIEPLGAGASVEEPGQVPGRAQAGEAVVQRLLLGLAQQIHQRPGIEPPAGRARIALG